MPERIEFSAMSHPAAFAIDGTNKPRTVDVVYSKEDYQILFPNDLSPPAHIPDRSRMEPFQIKGLAAYRIGLALQHVTHMVSAPKFPRTKHSQQIVVFVAPSPRISYTTQTGLLAVRGEREDGLDDFVSIIPSKKVAIEYVYQLHPLIDCDVATALIRVGESSLPHESATLPNVIIGRNARILCNALFAEEMFYLASRFAPYASGLSIV